MHYKKNMTKISQFHDHFWLHLHGDALGKYANSSTIFIPVYIMFTWQCSDDNVNSIIACQTLTIPKGMVLIAHDHSSFNNFHVFIISHTQNWVVVSRLLFSNSTSIEVSSNWKCFHYHFHHCCVLRCICKAGNVYMCFEVKIFLCLEVAL